MFEASGRWRRAARAQTGLPVFGVDDEKAARLAAAAHQAPPQGSLQSCRHHLRRP